MSKESIKKDNMRKQEIWMKVYGYEFNELLDFKYDLDLIKDISPNPDVYFELYPKKSKSWYFWVVIVCSTFLLYVFGMSYLEILLSLVLFFSGFVLGSKYQSAYSQDKFSFLRFVYSKEALEKEKELVLLEIDKYGSAKKRVEKMLNGKDEYDDNHSDVSSSLYRSKGAVSLIDNYIKEITEPVVALG